VAERRLVAVLGYSRRRGRGLHPICAARLAAAEQVAGDADAVLLSGWARHPGTISEATLMKEAWAGPPVPLLADGDARSTLGNARAVAAAAREAGATQVTLVTSSWHRRRARMLVGAALGPDVRLEVVTPPRTSPPGLLARELVCLLGFVLVRRLRGPLALTVLGLSSVAVAVAAPSAPSPRNLVATPAVKEQLRATHLATMPAAMRTKVRGPLKGTTYYGSYGAARYAIATFSTEGVGTQDQPELFSKPSGRAWRDRGDTGGCISSRIIPAPLLRLWGFERDRLNPPCFLP
jgi:hypothetical protein